MRVAIVNDGMTPMGGQTLGLVRKIMSKFDSDLELVIRPVAAQTPAAARKVAAPTLAWVDDVAPDRLLTFGPLALMVVRGDTTKPKISSERGMMRWHEGARRVPHVIAANPAAVWVDPEFVRDMGRDLRKVLTQDEPIVLPPAERVEPANADELRALLARMPSTVTCDVETTGFDARRDSLLSVGVGALDEPSIILPRGILESEAVKAELWDALWSGRRVIGHNFKFDLKFLARWWGSMPGPGAIVGDTMLLSHLLDERPVASKYKVHGLKDLTRTRYDVPDYHFDFESFHARLRGDEGTEPLTDDDWAVMHGYHAADCRNTALLWRDLTAQAASEHEGLMRAHDTLSGPATLALADAELRGMPVDLEFLKAEAVRLTRRIARRERALQRAIGNMEFKPGSVAQFTAVVMGKPTTSAEPEHENAPGQVTRRWGILPTKAEDLGIRDIAEAGLGQYYKFDWGATLAGSNDAKAKEAAATDEWAGVGDSADERARRAAAAAARRAGATGQFTGMGQYHKLEWDAGGAKRQKHSNTGSRGAGGGVITADQHSSKTDGKYNQVSAEELWRQAGTRGKRAGEGVSNGLKLDGSIMRGAIVAEESDEPIYWPNVAAKKGKVRGEYVEPPTSTGTGEMRELVTRLLANGRRHEARWIASALFWRLDTKQLSTYVQGWLDAVGPDGRMHAQFNLGGTVTGRLSSSAPNLHAIPKRGQLVPVRKQIHASPGWTLVEADYSQLELRVAAILSGDEALITTYQEGRDLHMEVAVLMLNKPASEVAEKERYLAKAVDFGVLYGRSAQAIAQGDAMHYFEHVMGGKPWTVEETEVFIKRFLDGYPKLRDWLKEAGNDAVRRRIIDTPFGRRRRLYLLSGERRFLTMLKRQGVNTPIQAAASDLCLNAFINLWRVLDQSEAKVLSIVHDSILVEVRDDRLAAVIPQIVEAMKDEAPIDTRGVPLDVDVKVGQTLADADMAKWKS